MKKYTFLLPLYNDWKSLQKLIDVLDKQLKKIKVVASFLIIDDCSSIIQDIKFKSKKNIKSIKILRLKKNLGSQKAISVGLKYLYKKKDKSIITILDSDGEDDPVQIKYMIQSAKIFPENVTVSCRERRREGLIFKFLYFFHKFITFTFTFKWISFGNYAAFHSNLIRRLISDNSSWFALSSTYIKNSDIKRLYADRKKRYFGKSKLSLNSLFIQSMRVNCVFLKRIFITSAIYVLILYILNIVFLKIILFLIILFNSTIFFIYFQTNPGEYKDSQKLIDKITVLK